MDFDILRKLVETPGVSGREERVAAVVAEQLAPITADITFDAMGNVIAHRPGVGPRVALIAHMDEIGFLVSKIESDGYVRVIPVGAVDARIFAAQKVMVHGRRDLPGVVGSIPPHLLKKSDGADRKEALGIEESFIDLGLPADEVKATVQVGDPVTFGTACWENDHAVFAKALDDRVGLFVMLCAVTRAAKIDCDLYLIASVQEEFGLRGAGPAVFSVQPDIVLVLEGTVASDTPGINLPANIMPTTQGGGPEIRLTDRAMIAHRSLADFIAGLGRQAGIPHQVIIKQTGATDAAVGQVSGKGVKACVLSVPVRYIHAPVAMARKTDIDHSAALLAAFVAHASEMTAGGAESSRSDAQ